MCTTLQGRFNSEPRQEGQGRFPDIARSCAKRHSQRFGAGYAMKNVSYWLAEDVFAVFNSGYQDRSKQEAHFTGRRVA